MKKKSKKKKLPFPDMRIDCYGKSINVYLDGRDISGVKSVTFRAEGGKEPMLDLSIAPHAASLDKVKPWQADTDLVAGRRQRLRKKKIK